MGAVFQVLTSFGPLAGAKFWVAVAMAAVQFLQIQFGLDIGLDESTATAVIGGVGALLVWLVPNKPKRPTFTEAEALRYNEMATGVQQTHIPRR